MKPTNKAEWTLRNENRKKRIHSRRLLILNCCVLDANGVRGNACGSCFSTKAKRDIHGQTKNCPVSCLFGVSLSCLVFARACLCEWVSDWLSSMHERERELGTCVCVCCTKRVSSWEKSSCALRQAWEAIQLEYYWYWRVAATERERERALARQCLRHIPIRSSCCRARTMAMLYCIYRKYCNRHQRSICCSSRSNGIPLGL